MNENRTENFCLFFLSHEENETSASCESFVVAAAAAFIDSFKSDLLFG